MEVIFINSDRANFEQLLSGIIADQLKNYLDRLPEKKSEQTTVSASATSPFLPGVRYGLSDEVVVQNLGFSNIKHPVRKIISELRSFGIEIETKQRSGSVAFGSDLNNYLQQKRASQKSYQSRR